MLPHSFLGVIISALVIVGAGALLYAPIVKRIIDSQNTVAYYAALVIVGVIHPLSALIAVVISIYLLIRGKRPEKIAAIAFLVVAIIIYLISHAFLIFHL